MESMDLGLTAGESEDWDLREYKSAVDSSIKDSATSMPNYQLLSTPVESRHHLAITEEHEKHRLNIFENVTVEGIVNNSDNLKTKNDRHGDQVQNVNLLLQKTSQITILQKQVEADVPEGVLSISLLRHQKIALAWMLLKEQDPACSGGILADDQGLGKTVTTIALILKQKYSSEQTLTSSEKSTGQINNSKLSAGTLVVCPASLLRQWYDELLTKTTKEANLKVLMYYGENRPTQPIELTKYDVVLTTYATVNNEVTGKKPDSQGKHYKQLQNYSLATESESKRRKLQIPSEKNKGRSIDDASLNDNRSAVLKVSWHRIVLDEAQTIKNVRTEIAKSCCALSAEKRWCLSGTPIQNSIDEIYSYFRFLRSDPYAEYESFCNQIKNPIASKSENCYTKLQAVLSEIMLRRTKDSTIDGKPIIDLPSKKVTVTKVEFSTEERTFYSKLEAQSYSIFKKYADEGTLRKNYATIFSMLLRLRQACNHPTLVKENDSEAASQLPPTIAEGLPLEIVQNLITELESQAICNICKKPPQDSVVSLCAHLFCNRCVRHYLNGADRDCPSETCSSSIGEDIIFTKITLQKNLINKPSNDVLHGTYISAKIKSALNIILSNCASTTSHTKKKPIKTIVFSQWTGMLDLFQRTLEKQCLKYRRLDGSMSLVARDLAVKEFKANDEVIVMLMSLKAGNLGLNMTAASHVILLDPWWNPSTEDQAIDRAHRIGQTIPVTVYRLTVSNTIEDRILALQDDKRKMVASALGEDDNGTHAGHLSAEDLNFLFTGTN